MDDELRLASGERQALFSERLPEQPDRLWADSVQAHDLGFRMLGYMCKARAAHASERTSRWCANSGREIAFLLGLLFI